MKLKARFVDLRGSCMSAVLAVPVTTVVATVYAVLKRIVPSVIVLGASMTAVGLPRCSGDSSATATGQMATECGFRRGELAPWRAGRTAPARRPAF